MRVSRLFIVLTLTSVFFSCDEKKEEQPIVPQIQPKKKLIKKVEKSWDSLKQTQCRGLFHGI